MTPEHKRGLIVLIALAALISLTVWVAVALIENLSLPNATTPDLADYLLLVLLGIWVGTYVYKTLSERHRGKSAVVRSGFRTVEVKGYKDSAVLVAVLMDRLNGDKEGTQ